MKMEKRQRANKEQSGGVTVVAALFLAFLGWKRFGPGADFMTAFILVVMMCHIARTDWLTFRIPNRQILFLLVPAALSFYANPEVSAVSRLSGIFVISTPMFLMNQVRDGCFGGGDIKLMAVSGLLLGWKGALTAMFFAVMTGGSYAGWLMVSGRAKRGAYMAFGPFLALGIVMSYFYGNELLTWYLRLF